MARNLIKIELNQLKEKALHTEKDMINGLLDHLETKIGLRAYSAYSTEVAESYVLNEAVKNVIAIIRENIEQINTEIAKAQLEHDEAAGEMRKDAMSNIIGRLNNLREKLGGLTQKLFDRLTGRNKSPELYGADAGLRYVALHGSDSSYIISEMVKVAAEQLRARVFKLVEKMGEAKREVQKAFGQNKKIVQEHLRELQERLGQSLAELKDALLGRKIVEEIEEDIKDQDKVEVEAKLLTSQNYVIKSTIKNLVEKLRVKILQVIEELSKAKRAAEQAAGEAKDFARVHQEKLREQLKKLTQDAIDAIRGERSPEEIERDME
ncbi:uncharacterized protein LOC100897439 isoform X2 [Galendromus occidentalis]|nr:uncharacterized protein LOC100897439 isoform X2 [Galendromus occidentalis]